MNFAASFLALAATALLCFAKADEPAPVLSHPVDIARPPAAFVTVNKSLREAECLRADFSEEKKIKVLKKPLLSAGALVFSGESGLYRALKQPFVQELLVTPQGIVQRDSTGRIETVEVDRQPLAKGFIDAFLLVFSGEDKALAEQFEIFFDGDAQAWSMGFVPRKKPLSKFIASLVVHGKKNVIETLVVVEVNGDRTTTKFERVVTDKPLTADEKERFFGWRQ